MDDQQFKLTVVEKLSSIQTTLLSAVGTDGNGGKVGELREEVNELRRSHDRQKGFFAGIGLVWTALLGVITIIGEWLYHSHGGPK